MSLIKKIDVEKHFAERRAMRLGRMQPVSRLGATWIKSTVKRNRVSASVETPTLVHSSLSVSSDTIPIASDSGRNRLLRPPGSRQQWK
jgi:hypothetical protein